MIQNLAIPAEIAEGSKPTAMRQYLNEMADPAITGFMQQLLEDVAVLNMLSEVSRAVFGVLKDSMRSGLAIKPLMPWSDAEYNVRESTVFLFYNRPQTTPCFRVIVTGDSFVALDRITIRDRIDFIRVGTWDVADPLIFEHLMEPVNGIPHPDGI